MGVDDILKKYEQETCEYCNTTKFFMGKNFSAYPNDEFQIYSNKVNYYIFAGLDLSKRTDDISNSYAESSSIKINYCPMCGRKLTDD